HCRSQPFPHHSYGIDRVGHRLSFGIENTGMKVGDHPTPPKVGSSTRDIGWIMVSTRSSKLWLSVHLAPSASQAPSRRLASSGSARPEFPPAHRRIITR